MAAARRLVDRFSVDTVEGRGSATTLAAALLGFLVLGAMSALAGDVPAAPPLKPGEVCWAIALLLVSRSMPPPRTAAIAASTRRWSRIRRGAGCTSATAGATTPVATITITGVLRGGLDRR